MTEGETILKMIEVVDPADKSALDRIDGRVWCWLSDCEYIGHDNADQHNFLARPKKEGCAEFYKSVGTQNCYTRSRDALKAIRPQGWRFWIHSEGTCEAVKRNETEDREIISQAGTEELAELHAITQAIAHERGRPEMADAHW
jgi:hypothetical protein